MSGDYSRYGFDPTKDFSSVLLQQGRPLTDRDWNEQAIQMARRVQAAAFDTFGASGASGLAVRPATTPNGFAISFDTSGNLLIGQGRAYVDGLMVENHGAGPATWDPALAETFGANPLPYTAQPYFPNPPALPASGDVVVAYLDVWEREVTQFEDPQLVESALGVDTTTRRQTAWQLRFLTGQPAGATCATPVTFPAPSGGRLTTGTATVPGQSDPCIIPPSAGYTGLENQLYRIEIHQGGAPGTATFKWSSNNASIEARVLSFVDLSHIVVDSVGRDDVLRFSDGDWIEITDDWREFGQQPGELHHIKVGGGVDDATRTITLEPPITAGLFPTDAQGNLTASRNTRIRRWDQQGKIIDKDGKPYADLDAAGSTGAITVPVSSAVSILLENGVVASFSIDPSGGTFEPFDYWVFAARANDGTVESLAAAPPRGIHHHYGKLAVITFPNKVTSDCRVPWPPAQTGQDCACTACVSPKSHQDGSYTLQKAVDDVSKTGGTVCLAPGTYTLAAPVTVGAVSALRIVGQGAATVLQATGGAFDINSGGEVRLEDFEISGGEALAVGGASAIQVESSALTVERLRFSLSPKAGTGAAINFASLPINATVKGCNIRAPSGIVYTPPAAGVPPATGAAAATAPAARAAAGAPGVAAPPDTSVFLVVEDNQFLSTLDAVTVAGQGAAAVVVQVSRNRISACTLWGIALQFPTIPVSTVKVEGNLIMSFGDGVLVGANGLRVLNNDVGFFNPTPGIQDGIVLFSTFGSESLLPDCEILGNRIGAFPSAGVAIRSPVNRAMIKQNQISDVGDGIVLQYALPNVTTPSAAISIENNQITDVGMKPANSDAGPSIIAAGVWVHQAASVQVAGNTILRVGLNLSVAKSRVGIFVTASDRATISGNEISDVGPVGDFVGPAVGISVLPPFGGVDIAGNMVRRFSPALGVTTVDSSDWTPVLVLGAAPKQGDQFTTGAASAGRFAEVFVRPPSPIAENLANTLKVAPAAAAKAEVVAAPSSAAATKVSAQAAPALTAKEAPAAPVAAAPAAAGAAAAATAAPAPVAAAPPPSVAALPAPIRVEVRGNQLEGHGSQAVALLFGQNDCVFAENHCALATPGNQRVNTADVVLGALTVIASGNRITGGATALAILAPSVGDCSVVGNITLGAITVDGAALAAPWTGMNVGGV